MAAILMSADIAITDPCLVFALRRESMYFRAVSPYQQRFPGAPCQAQFRGPAGQTVLMLETGVGAAMEKALRWCLSEPRFGNVPYRPRAILCSGFSGALHLEQRVGDVILASEIIDQDGNCWPASWPIAYAESDSFRRGRLLTMPDLVGNPSRKRQLGKACDALAVDMESALVARLCHEYGVPFACLRVISDDLNTSLSPSLLDLLRHGRVSPHRLAWQLVRRPALSAELWRLEGRTRRAAKRFSVLHSLMAAI